MAKDYHRIATDLVGDFESELTDIQSLVAEIREVAENGTLEDVINQVDSVIADINDILKQF